MLSCRDIANHAEDIISHSGSWRQRLAIRLHLLMCEHCRRFIAQYRRVSSLVSLVEQPAGDAEIARVLENLPIPSEHSLSDGEPKA